jgi:hypothetical protein
MTKITHRTKHDGYRLRDGDQIPTPVTTLREIMSSPTFALGVEDVRAGRGFRDGYDEWSDTNNRWFYECGRQWAQQAPVALKRDGKVTEEAVRWFNRASIL